MREVDRWADRLVGRRPADPRRAELAYEERFAHDLLTDLLEEAGLAPERSAFGIETAFRAAAGPSGPTVAVLCEYDALPGIGHACGHNVIAAAGLGAALAAAALARGGLGRLVVLGTPAEEGGGGKIELARRGAFDGVDAAMMVHPADADLAWMDCIAIQQLEVSYDGEAAARRGRSPRGPQRPRRRRARLPQRRRAAPAHPADRADPRHLHQGRRQAEHRARSAPPRCWYVRSDTIGDAAAAEGAGAGLPRGGRRGRRLLAATTRGTTIPYADMRDNGPMSAAYAANAAPARALVATPDRHSRVVGSTDMGNVSYLVPSIHPMIQVAPAGVPIHTPEFAEYAGGEAADRAVLDGAKAMAMTVVDLWADGGCLRPPPRAAEFGHAAPTERALARSRLWHCGSRPRCRRPTVTGHPGKLVGHP